MRQNEFERTVRSLTKTGRQLVRRYAKNPSQIPPWMWLVLQIFFPGTFRVLQEISTTMAFAQLALRIIQEIDKGHR